MLQSMTGFGQAQRSIAGYQVRIDIRSVNHRYCEVVVRMPREWARFEDMLRRTVLASVKRGRVDVYVGFERLATAQKSVEIDWSLVEGYRQAAEQIASRLALSEALTLKDLLAIPDVVLFHEHHAESDEMIEQELQQCLSEALSHLMHMREVEGRNLQSDLSERLKQLEEHQSFMKRMAPRVVEEYREKLHLRLQELTQDKLFIDEARLAMEVALFAEKCNIDEELTRLQSHLRQFHQLMKADEPVGRKMDFLIQEMNREVNTIGSKANHLELVNRVVAAKAELEKLREQVQNIE